MRSPKSVSSTVEWTNFILPTLVDRMLLKQLTLSSSKRWYGDVIGKGFKSYTLNFLLRIRLLLFHLTFCLFVLVTNESRAIRACAILASGTQASRTARLFAGRARELKTHDFCWIFELRFSLLNSSNKYRFNL